MCYACRELVSEDSCITFQHYNININEYQELSNQVFANNNTNNTSTDSANESK